MTSVMVPMDSMVPVSQFSRGGANAAFAKATDGHPVTVLRNNEPVYVIITPDDYRHYSELEREPETLRDAKARQQALDGDYAKTFNSVDEMSAFVDEL